MKAVEAAAAIGHKSAGGLSKQWSRRFRGFQCSTIEFSFKLIVELLKLRIDIEDITSIED